MGMNVQFIQATDRGTHGFPESQQKTHLRKRLFTPGERLRTPSSAVIFGNVGLNLEKGLVNFTVWTSGGDILTCRSNRFSL
jgi:hypothetical protein